MKRKKPPYIYNPSTNEFLLNIRKEVEDYERGRKYQLYFLGIIAIGIIILLIYQQFS
jgi:hypothetical protein